VIRYEGTVKGFQKHAARELRKAAMRGWTLREHGEQIQRALRKAMARDLRDQVLGGGLAG